MAITLIFEASGVTRAQYEQVRNEVAPGNRRPPGMQHHVAGPSDGGWYVVEVWDSQEALDRFVHEKLGQALQKAGITAQPRIMQVANVMD
jgi:quinol monooxygenase YgiN